MTPRASAKESRWWDKVVLAKSVNKLLLAASTSQAHSIVVTWYFVRFRANLCLQFRIEMAQGEAIIGVGLK